MKYITFLQQPGTGNRSRFYIEKKEGNMSVLGWVVVIGITFITGAMVGMILTALLIAKGRDDRP